MEEIKKTTVIKEPVLYSRDIKAGIGDTLASAKIESDAFTYGQGANTLTFSERGLYAGASDFTSALFKLSLDGTFKVDTATFGSIILEAVTANPSTNGEIVYYSSGATHEFRAYINGTVYSLDVTAV